MKFGIDKFKLWFNLRSEMEGFDEIHEDIEKGIVFKGTNLWILMFAIVVASVGLNVNSTAVIIGAMLISPLMGPINGIGYSLATYDFELFRKALKNFLFAVGVGLFTSTVYFVISPINQAHSELLARTSPTIYDVLIAFFGGLAGIVAMSSKMKGNVIPGVAIATALMPPLCTAGYGLATLQFNFFFGAFYLFTINTVFIAFASLLVCQYLNFPLRSIVDSTKKKKVNRFISSIIALTIIPSIFFGYKLVKNEEFMQKAESFAKTVAFVDKNYLQNKNINFTARTINLFYSGYGLQDSSKNEIKNKALTFGLDTSKIKISQGFEADVLAENINTYKTASQQLEEKLIAATFQAKNKDYKIDSLKNIPNLGKTLLEEIQTVYPEIDRCSYSFTNIYTNKRDSIVGESKVPVIIFSTKRRITNSEKNKIKQWAQKRLNNDKAETLFK